MIFQKAVSDAMKHLAVIPARSGSKGLKDKNIKELCGKPLMAYTIEAALESGIFEEVYVSTDSEAYAEVGRAYGAAVPFLRREQLASDQAGTWDVVRWTLQEYRRRGCDFSRVTLLQPTSPLRNAADLREAYHMFLQKGANAVVSVCEMEHSPLWSNVLPEDGNMNGFIRDTAVQRQRLPLYYRINGALYMVDAELLEREPFQLYGARTFAYRMPKERSVDIDDAFDFAMAEKLMEAQ